jgi:hypothetical protein
MQGLAGRQITMKPAFIRHSRAKFLVVAVTMAVPPRGCGAVIFIVWSRDNPVKYTDPDGRDTIFLTKDDIKVSKWHALNVHLNTYLKLKSDVSMQIRKNEIAIDLLLGEIKGMEINLTKQGFEDILSFVNIIGTPTIGALNGYKKGSVPGAIIGAYNNIDVKNVAEFFAGLKSETRLSKDDYKILKTTNKIEISRLKQENESLMVLKRSYQNEIDSLEREMRMVLEE